jgi:hypothetical protein
MSQHYNPPAPATSDTLPPPPQGERVTRWLLLLVWAVLTAAALAFVLAFGTNTPYADEWEFVPVLTGHEPALPWLWTQHNEHRLPLPRLVYYVVFQLTDSFRSGMVLQVAMLSALSLALTRFAAKLRGRPHWADAFFPVSLLHVGHWENLLMGYQLCFVLFTLLVTGIGVTALRTTRETAFRSGVTAGVLALMLSLCGGFGLVVALPVCGWLAYLAVIAGRTGPRWQAAVLVGLAVLPLLYLWAYQAGYERPTHGFPPERVPQPGEGGPRAVGRVTAQTLAMAFGIGAETVWPWACGGLLVLGGVTMGMLIRDSDRTAAVGLIAVAAGVAGLALAIGIGRSGFGDRMGLWSRYALLMWPLTGLAFLAWVKRGGRGGKWVPAVLCAAAALFFQANTQTGLVLGEAVRERQSAIEADAAIGKSPEEIAYTRLAKTGQEERAVRGIPMLRKARIGAFAGN